VLHDACEDLSKTERSGSLLDLPEGGGRDGQQRQGIIPGNASLGGETEHGLGNDAEGGVFRGWKMLFGCTRGSKWGCYSWREAGQTRRDVGAKLRIVKEVSRGDREV